MGLGSALATDMWSRYGPKCRRSSGRRAWGNLRLLDAPLRAWCGRRDGRDDLGERCDEGLQIGTVAEARGDRRVRPGLLRRAGVAQQVARLRRCQRLRPLRTADALQAGE